MPNNTDDRSYRDLARLLEHLIRNLPSPEPGQVVGFTVMTGAVPDGPQVFGFAEDTGEIDYELTEGQDEIFVTLDVPSDLRTAPYVDIQAQQIRIMLDDQVIEVTMPVPIDVRHCYYQVRHGVMDVQCRKR